MKRAMLIAMIFAAGASGACAQVLGAPAIRPQSSAKRNEHDATRFSPVGRWDQVLYLRPNWVIEVIDTNTSVLKGRFVRADVSSLTLVTSEGEREINRRDVSRVALIAAPDHDKPKKITKHAIVGAIVLAAGISLVPAIKGGKIWVPPVSVWALGAAYGGASSAIALAVEGRSRTIYVAQTKSIREAP